MDASKPLPRDRFAQVVRDTPLVSIDLVVRAPDDTVLLGLRTNQPARGMWFVPGGIVRKHERLDDAFRRLVRVELGAAHERADAAFLGAFEHHYDTNFAEEPGFGTHYVVLVHELRLASKPEQLPREQHRDYAWFSVDDLLAHDNVHEHVKAYFA